MHERLHEYSFSNSEKVEEETPSKDLTKQDIVGLFEPHESEYQNLLPNTGFDVPGEVVSFLTSEDDFETKVGRIHMNVRHFVDEYISRLSVLRNPVKIEDRKVVSDGYGEIPMTSYTNKTERRGMAYQEAEIVSRFLPQSPDGTIFISTSPKGTTGEKDFRGNFINHPESQTKMYVKDSGKLKAFTLRTDMTLEENVRFMQSISKKETILDGEYATEFDAICEVTGTVVSRHDLKPTDVIKKIQEAKHSDIAWVDKGKEVTFHEMYQALKMAQQPEKLNKKVEAVLKIFDKKIRQYNKEELSDEEVKELAVLIGQTVIRVYEKLEGKPLEGKTTVQRISELGGCAGGGQESTRTRIVNGEVEYFVKQCPFCKKDINGWIKKGFVCACSQEFKIAC